MKPKINDTVQLVNAYAKESIAAGAIGVVVAELCDEDEIYEVEFCNEQGQTIALATLRANQFVVVA
jgi:hypothetical protein